MPYSLQRLRNAFTPSNQIAACIGIFLIALPCSAADYVIDDAIEFQATDCWIKPASEHPTDCGWLMVPEDWGYPNERQLKLPVVIYHAADPDSSLHPVIYLSGGPGVPALGQNGKSINGWRRSTDAIFPGRTVIVFDQRGMGLGSPKLECQGVGDPKIWNPISNNPNEFPDRSARGSEIYAACAEKHMNAGHDLTAFNTLQSAADVEALRLALGFEDVILFGISYGTRLALTVMKNYPTNIYAAILDSPFPPQAEYPGYYSDGFGAVLERLFQACQKDESCAAAYPDLRQRFLSLLQNLAENPVVIEITNLEVSPSGEREPLYVRVNDVLFLNVLREELYNTARLSQLPAFIAGAAKGEYWRLKSYVENTISSSFSDKADTGATLSITCNDDADTIYRPPTEKDFEAYPHLKNLVMWNHHFNLCAVWPMKPGSGNRDPVVSKIPSLLLAGGLDPSTPVELAELAARTLDVSHVFVFPANGHVQIKYDECAWEVIGEFMTSPAKRPNPDCLTSLRQPAFITY